MSTNLIFSITTVLFAGFFLIYSWALPRSVENLGPGGWPTMVLLLMFCLAIVLCVKTFREERRKKSLETKGAEQQAGEEEADLEQCYPYRHWLVAGIILVYLFITQYIGMLIATPIFIFVTAMVLGMRNWVKLIVISLLCTIFIVGLFAIALSLSLPQGMGIFREFNMLFY